MNLLLDTQIFLWLTSDDPRLPQALRDAVTHPDNVVYFSLVSLWEILIKFGTGKLPLPEPPEVFLPKQRDLLGTEDLPILEAAVWRLLQLPPIHKDPFDRLLVCQALHHDLTLCTVDALLQSYPVKLWQPP